MWPLYLLLNKFLKPEEQNVDGADTDHLSLVESYQFRQRLYNKKCNDAVLPCSHCVEVSDLILFLHFLFDISY